MNYNIYEKNLSDLVKRIDRLSKRGVKIGNAPITIKVTGKTSEEPHPTIENRRVRLLEVEVNGEMPYYNGWHFMATICNTKEGNVIRSVPGYDVPAEYRDGAHTCDHCKTNRLRRDTYIVRHDDGTTKRVGSTCLQEFLAYTDANRLSAAAEYCIQAYDVAEAATKHNWLGGAGREIFRYDLLTYLSYVAQIVIKDQRFITSKAAQLDGRESTARCAEHNMTHPDMAAYQTYQPTDEAKKLADDAREWVISAYAPAIPSMDDVDDSPVNFKRAMMNHFTVNKELSEFEHNLLTVARSEAIEPRLKGIAAFIIEAYRREQAKLSPPPSVATLNKEGLTAIFDMFTTAAKNLKSPKIRLVSPEGIHMTLKLAAATSKNAGYIYVCGASGSDQYFGKISPNGKFFSVSSAPATVEKHLKTFADNPHDVAAKYGHLTGCCCFCSRTLTDKRSTKVGYGPVCADKFGLGWGVKDEDKTETEAVANAEAAAANVQPAAA